MRNTWYGKAARSRPRLRYWRWQESSPPIHPSRRKLAELYLRNGDPGRALSIYLTQLAVNKKDNAAILGAAQASFAAGSYAAALRYLEELKPETAESQALRLQLERMEALDPFARSATGKIRTERTMAVFRIAIDAPGRMRSAIRASSVQLGERRQMRRTRSSGADLQNGPNSFLP